MHVHTSKEIPEARKSSQRPSKVSSSSHAGWRLASIVPAPVSAAGRWPWLGRGGGEREGAANETGGRGRGEARPCLLRGKDELPMGGMTEAEESRKQGQCKRMTQQQRGSTDRTYPLGIVAMNIG